MIRASLIVAVFLTTFTTAAAVDDEPPVFTFCPSDISFHNEHSSVRINWPRPIATDNSGIPPMITASRQSGDSFEVPGSYEVVFTAEDHYGNVARCSFRITLTRKPCQLYPPPKGGALACINIDGKEHCAIMCQQWLDFNGNPAMMYYCRKGELKMFSVFPFDRTLPWPDCSNRANPSIMRMLNLPYYYFDGNANDTDGQSDIRNKFYSLLTSLFIPSEFCLKKPTECTKEKIAVIPGAA